MNIAELKARLSYVIDDRNLRHFEKSLKDTHRNLNKAGESFKKQVRQSSKTQLAGLTAVEKRLNKQRGQLWQLRNDYFRVNQEFKAGNISHERRSRLLNDINYQYRQQRRHVRELNREVSRHPSRRLGKFLNQPVSGSGGYFGGSTGIRAGATAGIASRLAGPAAAGGAAVLATGMAAHASNTQYQQFIGARTSLQGITGTLEEANKKLRMLARLSEFLGTNFLDSARSFTSWSAAIQGTSMEGASGDRAYQQLQAFFKSRDLGRPEQAQAMRAISQMLQKGTLYSEEVFGQLSEAGIPAQMLVDALGMKDIAALRKQLEAGNVRAQRAIPLLAAEMERRAFEGGSLESARTNTRSEQNRAINRATFANIYANTTGIDEYFREFYRGLQNLVENAMPVIEEIGEAFKSMAPATNKSLSAFGNVLGAVGNVFDSMDGVRVSNGVVTLAYVLNNIADFINDVADTIGLVRSDESWKDKLSGISTMLVNQLERIAETFLNMIIGKVNYLLPKAMEIGPVSFESERIHTPTVDLSSVNALLGNINTEINKVGREAINPLLNAQGGINNPNELPFGPPIGRDGKPITNQTTVHQNNNVTFEINANNPDEVMETIESHWTDVLRMGSMNSPVAEK
ncbi:tape measure protein [Chromohalobacter israelensis]|uniref:tape measure protein n=1 Tax=Chromohalobacter israelensis TaxID=141390 RepID=UPI000D712BCD|nr:tape measure protein [Chromohalobacter salexigens]PWW33404.1 tape measure domain-containing protein [Chromohalobacter salexigens]